VAVAGISYVNLFRAIDGHEKRIENLKQDHAAGNHQLSRHDTWIKQLARDAKTNLVE
jgi:hypothetical protein